MQLSIIIVNYNVKFFLEHCLLSVIKACRGLITEIIVVDNNSTDGSKEYLIPKFPSVKFIWNSMNVGFGKASNRALSIARGDFILFLNPDTILPEDCFTKCISFFKKHADCGAVGVRMTDGSGIFLKESKRCLPTPAAGLFKMMGLSTIFAKSSFFAKYYAGHLPEKENNKAEVLAGAFMMISKRAIKITKGFDENFFMYGEDIDLSYSILKAGFHNYYLGETTIIHFKGESTQKKDAAYIKHFYGAMKLFVDKHYKKNTLKYPAMSVAIAAGKLMSKIKNNFTQNKSSSFGKVPVNTLFIGEEQQYEQVKDILKKASYSLNIFFNILNDYKIEIINEIINEKNIGAVIFSENESFNNSEIIKIAALLPTSCKFFFYENGAGSIIGSHNKNERGEFISNF